MNKLNYFRFTFLILTCQIIFIKNENFLDNTEIKDSLIPDEMEDIFLSFEEIVLRKGYPLESYFVETEDGYILKLYRIPGKKFIVPNKKVVLLQHGLNVFYNIY